MVVTFLAILVRHVVPSVPTTPSYCIEVGRRCVIGIGPLMHVYPLPSRTLLPDGTARWLNPSQACRLVSVLSAAELSAIVSISSGNTGECNLPNFEPGALESYPKLYNSASWDYTRFENNAADTRSISVVGTHSVAGCSVSLRVLDGEVRDLESGEVIYYGFRNENRCFRPKFSENMLPFIMRNKIE